MKKDKNVIWYDWNNSSGFELQEMNREEPYEIIEEIKIQANAIIFKPVLATCNCKCNL